MAEDVLNILQITDTHLYADKNEALLGVPTQKSLVAVIQWIQDNHQYPIDFILHSGDISQDHSEASYRVAEELFSVLNVPVYFVAGNHDDSQTMDRVYPLGCFLSQKSLLKEYWQLILLDSHKPGEVQGYLSQQQLIFLERCLKANPLHHALVMLHHQPVPAGCAWLDPLGLGNAGEFWKVLSRYPQMNTVLFGHVHQEISQSEGNIQCYSAPSTCIQFKGKQDHFGLDDLPQGYRWLRLHGDGHVETAVIRLPHYVGHFDKNAQGY